MYFVSIQTAADALPSIEELTHLLKSQGVVLEEIDEQEDGECWLTAEVTFAESKIESDLEEHGFIEISINVDISLHCDMP